MRIIPAGMHVLEAAEGGDGLGRLEASPRIGDESDPGDDLVVLDHQLIGAIDPLHPGRPRAERLVDASRPQIRRLEHVRIGRQDERGCHGPLLSAPSGARPTYYHRDGTLPAHSLTRAFERRRTPTPREHGPRAPPLG